MVVQCQRKDLSVLPISLAQQKIYREETIVLLIEDQAFSPSYDFATPALPSSLASASYLSFSVFLCAAGRAYLRKRGEVGGGEAK